MFETIITALKVWKWPEYAMTWKARYDGMMACKAKRRKAEQELGEFERDAPARERETNQRDIQVRVEKAKRTMRDKQISRVPGETDEVNNEAMRQIRAEAEAAKWRNS